MILKSFMLDESKKVRDLHETNLKLDEHKNLIIDQTNQINLEIGQVDYQIKSLKHDIEVCLDLLKGNEEI